MTRRSLLAERGLALTRTAARVKEPASSFCRNLRGSFPPPRPQNSAVGDFAPGRRRAGAAMRYASAATLIASAADSFAISAIIRVAEQVIVRGRASRRACPYLPAGASGSDKFTGDIYGPVRARDGTRGSPDRDIFWRRPHGFIPRKYRGRSLFRQ